MTELKGHSTGINMTAVSALLRGLNTNNIEVNQCLDPGFWTKNATPNDPKKSHHGFSFGNEIRCDIYSDERGNILKRKSTFGKSTSYGEKPTNMNDRLHQKQDIYDTLINVKKHEAQCDITGKRKFV